jgi:hypothetical protein
LTTVSLPSPVPSLGSGLPLPRRHGSVVTALPPLIILIIILAALLALVAHGLAPQAALTVLGGGALLAVELRNRLL